MVTRVSETVSKLSYGSEFAQIQDTSLGALQFKVAGGPITDNSSVSTAVDTTLDLDDDSITNVVISFDTGIISTEANAVGISFISLFIVTTASGVISTVVDNRSNQTTKQVTPINFAGRALTEYYKLSMDNIPGTYLPLDETDLTARHIQDISGNSANGRLLGNLSDITAVAGPGGPAMGALRFAAKGSTVSDAGSLMLTLRMLENTSLTTDQYGMIGFWFKIEGSLAGTNYLFSYGQDTSTTIQGYARVNSAGRFRWHQNFTGSGFDLETNDGAIIADTWYWAVIREANASSDSRLWINGVDAQNGTSDTGAGTQQWWEDQSAMTNREIWELGGGGWAETTSGGEGTYSSFQRSGITERFNALHLSNFQIWVTERVYSDPSGMIDMYNFGSGN